MFSKWILRLTSFLFFCLFFQSCVSTQAHWQKKVYQPQKRGVIYYDPRPNLYDSSAVQQRRQSAKMKMRSFCEPEKAKIVSEEKEEEVIGRQTYFSSQEDNPSPTYRETVKANNKFYEKSAQMFSSSFLSSSGTQTEQDLVRERIYIIFTCE
ncbi:MAG: hypothetical protein OXN83_00880 [Oligoflexia bacterium]|nr:hypothetical protein [Oligoflexia bacterium]